MQKNLAILHSYGMNTTQCWKTIASQFIRVDNDRFHCQLCIAHSSASLFYANRHFEQAHANHSLEVGGEFIFICKKGCRKLGHYHCHRCKKIFPKKTLLQKHVNVCASAEEKSSSQLPLPPRKSELNSKSDSVEAPSPDVDMETEVALPVLSSSMNLQDFEADSEVVIADKSNHSLSVHSPKSSKNEDKV